MYPQDSKPVEPERFDGKNYPCRHFLVHLSLFFEQNPGRFPDDYSKSLCLLSLLKGAAFDWASPYLERRDPILTNYESFTRALSGIFEDPNRAHTAMKQLYSLRQGAEPASTFIPTFKHLASLTALEEPTLIFLLQESVNDALKDELAVRDIPPSFEELTTMIARLDQRISDRARDRAHGKSAPYSYPQAPIPMPTYQPPRPFTSPVNPIPMEIDASKSDVPEFWSHLSEREKRYLTRVALRQCTYCGSPDHKVENCTTRPKKEGKGKAQSQY